MTDEIVIRPATVADAPFVVHQRRAMFADMGVGDPAGLDAMDATFAPYVTRALDDGTYRAWLAQTSDGRVVAGGGLIVHEWPARPGNPSDPRRAYILNVYTEPGYRGRGFARRIVQAIVDWCRAEGLGSVSLHASVFGKPLYESMGFEPTNEMRLKLER
jgi:GNAT superfamily N-acetyltransferase